VDEVHGIWVIDLDGVVWRGDQVLPGAPQAIERLRSMGREVLFVTNNALLTIDEYVRKLGSMGIDISEDGILTSAQAAASLLRAGERVLVCAGAGVKEAVARSGAIMAPLPPVDTVVVGWHLDFDFEELTHTTRAIHQGARLIGTNEDATYPVPEGLLPGGGALLAAVATAGEVEPVVAGKPHEAMVELIKQHILSTPRLAGRNIEMVVGDRPMTDGKLAQRLEAPFTLVLSGVLRGGVLDIQPAPVAKVNTLLAAVNQLH
jgi:4-nitrophenyl phosphatase